MAMPSSLFSFHFPVPTTLNAPQLSRQCIPCVFIPLNNRSSGTKQNLRSGSSKIIACVGEGTAPLSNHSNNMTTDSLSAGILTKREFPEGVWKDDIIHSLMSSNQGAAAAAYEKRVESLICWIKGMFRGMGDGETNASAYGTAWVAGIPAVDGPDHPHFPQTLQWIFRISWKMALGAKKSIS